MTTSVFVKKHLKFKAIVEVPQKQESKGIQ